MVVSLSSDNAVWEAVMKNEVVQELKKSFHEGMVVSLSSDNAVWEAVMKNEVVQELKKSFHEVGNYKSDEHPNVVTGTLRCILDGTKSRVLEFIDKIMKLVSGPFRSQEKNEEEPDAFNGALRSSFLLSVVVFIIVVVTRIQKA